MEKYKNNTIIYDINPEYWILDENNIPVVKTISLDIALEILSKYAYKENYVLCSATPYYDNEKDKSNNIISYDVETIGYFSIDNFNKELKPNYYDGLNDLIYLCKQHKNDNRLIEEEHLIILFSLEDKEEIE